MAGCASCVSPLHCDFDERCWAQMSEEERAAEIAARNATGTSGDVAEESS